MKPETGLINDFILDRKARGLSPNTLDFYFQEVGLFASWIQVPLAEVTPAQIRKWLIHLEKTRNQGGIHANFRALRAFYRWVEAEIGVESPLAKVKVKIPAPDPRPGVPMEDIRAMISTCLTDFFGSRDKAILTSLVDCGARRAEFLALDLGDIDLKTGQVIIRSGKGGKPRVTFLGPRARRAITKYLRLRKGPKDPAQPLWVNRYGLRLKAKGLEAVMIRRSREAGVPTPGLHDFRRTFALEMLRAGTDVFSLMRLMGHTSPQVLQRYLNLLTEDLQKAHENGSPAESL